MTGSRLIARQLARVALTARSSRPGPSVSKASSSRRSISHTAPLQAVSMTPHSSLKDPAVEESQRHLELGGVALEAGNVAEAKRSYQRSIEILPSASAHFNLGVCHYHEKEIDKAIEAWNHTISLSPDSADAHTNLASAYVMSSPSRPDLAVEHLKQAASITPNDAEVQFNLGAVLEACEQLEEAIVAYDRALKGGIERAQENIRNVRAKILSVKFGPKPEGIDALSGKQ